MLGWLGPFHLAPAGPGGVRLDRRAQYKGRRQARCRLPVEARAMQRSRRMTPWHCIANPGQGTQAARNTKASGMPGGFRRAKRALCMGRLPP